SVATIKQVLSSVSSFPDRDWDVESVFLDVFRQRFQLIRRHQRKQFGGRMHRQHVAPGLRRRLRLLPRHGGFGTRQQRTPFQGDANSTTLTPDARNAGTTKGTALNWGGPKFILGGRTRLSMRGSVGLPNPRDVIRRSLGFHTSGFGGVAQIRQRI